jgi:hypothetical protein
MLSFGQTNVPAAMLAVKTESGIHAGQVYEAIGSPLARLACTGC